MSLQPLRAHAVVQPEIKVDGRWRWPTCQPAMALPGNSHLLLHGYGHLAVMPIVEFGRKPVMTRGIFDYRFEIDEDCYSNLLDILVGDPHCGHELGRFNAISAERGLPADLLPELRLGRETRYALGSPPFSYVTERELQSYNWDQLYRDHHSATIDEYRILKAIGTYASGDYRDPGGEVLKESRASYERNVTMYHPGHPPKGYETLTNDDMERRLPLYEFIRDRYYTTDVVIAKKYSDMIAPQHYRLLRNIREVIDPTKKDVEDLRLVFGIYNEYGSDWNWDYD